MKTIRQDCRILPQPMHCKRLPATNHRHVLPLIWVVVLALCLTNVPARGEPIATVTTTVMKMGSLPVTLHVYGRIKAGADASYTVMAPLAATTQDVFVRQGAKVAKDAPLIRLVPSPQMASAYARAQTALRVARDLVRRTQKMVKSHLATTRQLAEAQQKKSDAETTLVALEIQGAGGPKILRAPFAAVVTAVSAQPGAIVSEGSPLVDLTRPSGLVLQAGAVPAQAVGVAKGNTVLITPLGASRSFPGTVLLRGEIADTNTGLVPIEINLPAGRFFSGESAEATIATHRARGYIVPHEAILVDEKGEDYVVQAVSGTAKIVPIRVLAAEDGKNVINGRLDAGAPVVLSGNYQLEDGMKLRIVSQEDKTKAP